MPAKNIGEYDFVVKLRADLLAISGRPQAPVGLAKLTASQALKFPPVIHTPICNNPGWQGSSVRAAAACCGNWNY